MLYFEKFNLAELPELGAAKYGLRPSLSMVVGSFYTYMDLERLSRGVAQALALKGVRKGDRVALLAENSPHWVIAWFGIVRAGAVVVPILNDFMPKQIANIIQHSGAKIVLHPRNCRQSSPICHPSQTSGMFPRVLSHPPIMSNCRLSRRMILQ